MISQYINKTGCCIANNKHYKGTKTDVLKVLFQMDTQAGLGKDETFFYKKIFIGFFREKGNGIERNIYVRAITSIVRLLHSPHLLHTPHL